MKIVAIIPARGGSKRVSGKNLSEMCGVPMLNWTIWASLDAGLETWVSTDDRDTALIAEGAGAFVHLRPAHLATDEAAIEPVIEDMLAGCSYDALMLLQPTSPLRNESHIRDAVIALESNSCDSVVSVVPDPGAFFLWTTNDDADGQPLYKVRPRTQDLSTLYRENGAIYGTTRSAWEKSKNRLSGKTVLIDMPSWASVDVDTMDDLEVARFWMLRELMRRNSVYARAARWMQRADTIPAPSLKP